MKTMIILTLIFAAACAIATFIENDHGTETAWAVVYGTRWFEILMILLAINLVGNIFRFKLYKKEKISTLLFHTGFLVILVGAAITRYIGFEGMMHIREGATVNQISTSNSYIQVEAIKEGKHFNDEQKILLSKISSNDFSLKFDVEGKEAVVKYKQYLSNAVEKALPDEHGKAMIQMLVLKEGAKPEAITLKDHESYHDKSIDITLNKETSNTEGDYLHIYNRGNSFFFKSNKAMSWFVMADKSQGNFEAD